MYLKGFTEKHNTHVITCGVSLQVFLQLETLSKRRRKSKLCRIFMTVPKCIIYMMETRTIMLTY